MVSSLSLLRVLLSQTGQSIHFEVILFFPFSIYCLLPIYRNAIFDINLPIFIGKR